MSGKSQSGGESNAKAENAGAQGDPKSTGVRDESGAGAGDEGKGGSGKSENPKDPKAGVDDKPKAPPPNAYPRTSRQKAGVGRVLHAFSPAWDGPRPVTVCNCVTDRGALESGMTNIVNGNITFDGSTEPKVLEHVRRRNSGNTFASVSVFDALTPEQRLDCVPALAHAAEWRASWNGHDDIPVHFEWPPIN